MCVEPETLERFADSSGSCCAAYMSDLTLPDYFPLVDKKKKCKSVATTFFDCFTEKGMRVRDFLCIRMKVTKDWWYSQEVKKKAFAIRLQGNVVCKAAQVNLESIRLAW